MAHEFGHAIHILAASNMPIIVFHARLPLAETVSVFAEMLLNDSLHKRLTRNERKVLLSEQIDDMYSTIMRQAYFTMFEIQAYKDIADHNATVDKVAQLYLDNLREQFGNSVDISGDFQWEWLYIPHFFTRLFTAMHIRLGTYL
jgi:oligoendopeptidase F